MSKDKQEEFIPVGQRKLAAMHFTTENLGMPSADRASQIPWRYAECVQAFACEGIDSREEYNYWVDEAQKCGFHGWDWNNNIWPQMQGEEEALSHGDHLPVGGASK